MGPPPSPNNGVAAAPISNNTVSRIRTIVFVFTVVFSFLSLWIDKARVNASRKENNSAVRRN